MLDINFDSLRRTEVFISGLDQRLQNHTAVVTDYVAPFTFGEIDDIFDTGGHGQWAVLGSVVCGTKVSGFSGERDFTSRRHLHGSATSLNHPGSIAEFGATEMVLGVSGDYFESTFGQIIQRCMKKEKATRRDRFMN